MEEEEADGLEVSLSAPESATGMRSSRSLSLFPITVEGDLSSSIAGGTISNDVVYKLEKTSNRILRSGNLAEMTDFSKLLSNSILP
jgi:hypothetical protein